MKSTLKFTAFATIFGALVTVLSQVPARGDNQYPLCAKGCVLSYRGYAGRNASSLVTDNTVQGVNPYETLLRGEL